MSTSIRFALLLVTALLLGPAFVRAAPTSPVVTPACLECHEDEAGEFAPLLEESVHKDVTCAQCHAYSAAHIEEHQEQLPFDQMANCSSCHKKEGREHRESVHGISIAEGIDEAANCWNCHGSHAIGPVKSPDSPVYPANLAATCGACHDDPKFAVKFPSSVKLPGKLYAQSVHGELVKAGRMDAATCVLCHGVHNIRNRVQPDSPIASFAVPKTCGSCHAPEEADYERSIHWVRAKRGVKDAPVCNDCHSEHSVQAIRGTRGNGKQARLIQEETCLRCHADPIIARRYGMNPDRTISYRDSYHGLAERRGDPKVPLCADCHGVHEILPRSHPDSRVNPDHVLDTCRTCHPSATAAFALGYSHDRATPTHLRVVYWVQLIYLWAISLMVVGMLLHNGVIFAAEMRQRWRQSLHAVSIPRFTMNEVVQHALLSLAFVVLALTGFALAYPDAWALRWLDLGEPVRQAVHRGAGVVLVVLGVYHLGYLVATRRGRLVLRALAPRWADLTAVWANLGWHLGLRRAPPEFDEFDYTEKLEYWALVWGTVVMAVTGAVLWLPEATSAHVGAWAVPLSTVVHFYEAVLATLAILLWHGFFVILHPRRYPLDFSMVNGRVTLQSYAEHHRASFRRLLLQWERVRRGLQAREAVDFQTDRVLTVLERAGHEPGPVLQDYLEREPELRAWVDARLEEARD